MAPLCLVVAVALISTSISSATCTQGLSPDDSTCLLQHTVNLKAAKSGANAALQRVQKLARIKNHHGQTPGDSTAKVPPVQIKQQSDIKELGTVSTPGTWKPYYAMAEADMTKQFDKIYPMISDSNFAQVLEVAAGACRNTEKLLPLANHVLVTDIDPTAVESCKHRFENRPDVSSKLSYAVVDGVHLPAADNSIDLVYQFDSGVHFHREVIRGYLKEFKRVLAPGGTGFFHHSNLAASPYGVNNDLDVTQNVAWRSNMSTTLFETYAKEAGLEMLCHPVVTWAGQTDIDSFARFRKPGKQAQKKQEKCPEHLDF